jgi:hypothetical protein
MPRYFFIVHGQFEIEDRDGQVLSDDAAALGEAAQVARELKRDYGAMSISWSIEVREDGRIVAIVPFSTVD